MKKQETITPKQYIQRYSTNASSIRSSKIIPPKLGEKGFGRIAVIKKSSTGVIKSTGIRNIVGSRKPPTGVRQSVNNGRSR